MDYSKNRGYGEKKQLNNQMGYGLNNLDIMVKPYIEHIKNGFYVEAGANNGIWQSNTKILEEGGWTGLLVEPNKVLCEQCRHNRPNSIVENFALVSEAYSEPEIEGWFDQQDYNHSLMGRIAADNEYRNDNDRVGNIIKVPVTTFNRLFKKHGITKIDFMSLDAEGYEIQILSGLDFSKFAPAFLLLETGGDDSKAYNDRSMFVEERSYKKVVRLSDNDVLYKYEL